MLDTLLFSLQHLFSQGSPLVLVLAVLGGFLPAVIWLMVWFRRDNHPEPKRLIAVTFGAGILCVPIVFLIQFLIGYFVTDLRSPSDLIQSGLPNLMLLGALVTVIFAGLEELLKFFASHWSKQQRINIDEPIDWVIYLVSAALGFAAAENALYLISPIAQSLNNPNFIINYSLFRFLGGALLHCLCSSIIGIFMAVTFYAHKQVKVFAAIVGLLSAIILHSIFNLVIISSDNLLFTVFVSVWFLSILVFVAVPKIKKNKKHNYSLNKKKNG